MAIRLNNDIRKYIKEFSNTEDRKIYTEYKNSIDTKQTIDTKIFDKVSVKDLVIDISNLSKDELKIVNDMFLEFSNMPLGSKDNLKDELNTWIDSKVPEFNKYLHYHLSALYNRYTNHLATINYFNVESFAIETIALMNTGELLFDTIEDLNNYITNKIHNYYFKEN